MKSARILVLTLVSLLLAFVFSVSLSVTLRAWGQEPLPGNSQLPASGGSIAIQDLGVWARRGGDAEMDKLVQEEAATEREVAALIESYTHTEGDKGRSDIKSKVATALEKEFDLQQKRRDLELSRVEARLKKVRELMKKRSEARQSIIDKRLDQLLREADGLGWTPPPGVNLHQNNPFVGKNGPRGGFPRPLPK
jgi:hypothetical protein